MFVILWQKVKKILDNRVLFEEKNNLDTCTMTEVEGWGLSDNIIINLQIKHVTVPLVKTLKNK